MSSIINGIGGLAEKITSLPTLIASAVLDGVKAIFIPDSAYVNEQFTLLKNEIQVAFDISAYDMKLIFGKEVAFSDIKVELYGSECTIVKTDQLKKAILGVRPYIRGFIVLLMVFYNINQFLSLIGQGSIAIGAGKELAQEIKGGDGQ